MSAIVRAAFWLVPWAVIARTAFWWVPRAASYFNVPEDKVVEWVGAGFGVTGAALLALHIPISGFGFVAFLVSNIFWVAWSVSQEADGLRFQQIAFTCTSLVGTYNWLFGSPATCS